MQTRTGKFNRLLHCGRLLQHFVCDAWIACESSDLNWIKKNQKTIRADTYQAVTEAQANGATTGAEAGKQRIVLPSSHPGGPRYMKQLYHDAIALSSKFGRPDLFATFTCNPKWREITENLLPGEQASDRPDLVARVFNMKLKALMHDILKKKVLGKHTLSPSSLPRCSCVDLLGVRQPPVVSAGNSPWGCFWHGSAPHTP